ncbi:substrate-binding domain-containing protein [Nonomuraea pusilla]|uniref:Amino acid/amide ABC transporter substrate-binding protein, HAAT family (TC 3.A.1.4.-) n=1 Tax=Nonomuraea pusilla TaxID=46177 RepID=A0A1H7SG62_9ACTN|nr:substrate-binding domain-containing protein [Nonomuraea pusilla]SEL70684.1 amino acid/amide ABC transporter substrate-binding protein, HAAT family (TC 3.A.1.4.-) [Nonomuraea pusilla]
MAAIVDPFEARLIPSRAVRIGLVVPVSGVLGLVGPCAINCAVLAAEELNARGGVLGRPVELVLVDGGRPAREVAAEVAGLVGDGAVQAVAGTHASDVRVEVVAAVAGRVPFVYAPPYEGGGHAPGVYFLGETPGRQLAPGLAWLTRARRARRWYLLGNDYVWPRLVSAGARRTLRAHGATVVGEDFVRHGEAADRLDWLDRLDRVAAARPDAILLTLIGSDLVAFNRAYAASGLGAARLCGALEEHGLLGIGGDGTGELYASMGYFRDLRTDASLRFAERYAARFGPDAPMLNAHGQGAYEAVAMLAALAARAGSLAVPELDGVADGTTITSARGRLTLTGRHVHHPVHLGRADGLNFLLQKPFH